MTTIRFAVALGAALAFALPAAAQVSVADPWIRGTVVQQMASGAFMKLTAAKTTRLVEARCAEAAVVEIHEMKIENNIMRMRAIPGLDLPAGQTVELKPGGYHVMLMDLKRQLKEGETVPLTLVFETDGKRETVEVKAPVRAPTARGEAMKQHSH